jgi:hypothetical protein
VTGDVLAGPEQAPVYSGPGLFWIPDEGHDPEVLRAVLQDAAERARPARDAFRAWINDYWADFERARVALVLAGLVPLSRCELAGRRRVATAMRRVERRAARRRSR